MLRADTPLPLLDPLVHPRLQHPLHLLVEPPRHDVQMQVRIAHVAVPHHLHHRVTVAIADEPGVREALPGVLDEGVEFGEGDREIVLVDAAEVAEGLGDAFAPGPEGADLRFVLREHAVGDDALAHDVLEKTLQFLAVVLGVGAARLDETVEGMSTFQRPLVLRDAVDEVLALRIHEFEGGEDLRELGLRFAEGELHFLEAFEAEEGDVQGFGALGAEDGDGGDDADGAFAADEELLEVVAGVVFAEFGEVVEDGAVGKDGFDAEDVAVQAAVAEEAEAPGVGGDVAADVAGAFGAEVEGEDVVSFGEVVVCDFEDDAGVDDEGSGDVVEGSYVVHSRHINHDLVKNGHGASHQAGVSTLRDDRQHVIIAVFQHLADFLRRAWLDHEFGMPPVFAHPVAVKRLQIVRRIL